MGGTMTTYLDDSGNPVTQAAPPPVYLDPNTGEPADQSHGTLPDDKTATDAWRGAVYSKMLNTDPGYGYQNADEIDKQMRAINPDYDANDSFVGAVETGFEETPLGMLIRGKAPDNFDSDSAFLRFVHGTTSFITDPVVLVPTVAGALADVVVPGAAIGGFVGGSALDAGLRKTMMDHYQKGDVKSFGELADRASDALWAATKGALGAEAFSFAGDLPVPGAIADKPLAATALRGAYQASAIATAGALLDGRVPKLRDFEDSALAVIPLNLATGGLLLKGAETKQALMDNYAENGTSPEEAEVKLQAQPPVKPDPPEGLRPAIKFEGAVVEAAADEDHSDLSERTLGTKPVTMEELEADPTLADDVLRVPEIHDQPEIDLAYELKRDALAAGEDTDAHSIEELYERNSLKSGRGFVTPDGKFLSREQAKAWVKKNEPDVHAMWEDVSGDPKGVFHSEDYTEARDRVNARNLAEGADQLKAASPELNQFLARNRTELNEIKAGGKGSKYGNSVLRTLLVGPRNLIRAEGAQVVSRLQRLIPDSVDQEALSFMRDYRDDPQELQSAIEEIRNGDNENLKAFIPSMERALNPSPEMIQADQQITQYFAKALALGRETGTLDSGIDPARYSPRLFVKAAEESEARQGTGSSKFTTKTPNAIRREYLRLLDPLKSGDIEARTFNALDELGIYADRMGTAVSTKLLATELENTDLGKHGTQEEHPEGWVELNPGRRSLAGFYVPKVVADAIAPMLREGEPQVAGLLSMQNYVKGLELGLSAFHMKALTITAMNNMTFAEFTRSLKSDNQSPEFEAREQHAALYGLTTTKTGVPVESYQGLKASSLPTGLDKLYDVPVIKQVDAFAKAVTRETFDTIQRKFKVMDFSQKESAWIAKHPNATDVEYGSAMRGISKEVNAAYGGLNWDVLGVSKGMQNFSRLLMLAPDWTYSNVLNLKYTGEGGPAGSAARSFWVKSFVTGFALTAAMSELVGGKYDIKHPEMVYMGKDKDGKEMYANWFFAGAPKDSITLARRVIKDGALRGLAEFIVYKAGPIASTITSMAFNTDATGKPISKRGEDFAQQTKDQAEFAAGKVAPITGKNVVETVQRLLTDKDRDYSYKDVLEAVGDVVGVTTIHEDGKTGTGSSKGILGGGRRKGFHLPGMRR
jgi:hypothetical protein